MRPIWLAIPVFLIAACGADSEPMSEGPDPSSEDTITLQMTSFTLAPGEETTKCQWFANPRGVDLEIREFESRMSEGTHHMFVTTGSPQDAPLRDCLPG